MIDQFDLKTFLLSPKGRVGRSPYFSFIAIVTMLVTVVSFGAGFAGASTTMLVAVIAVFLLLLWPVYCVTARRLHDINLPGEWALVVVLPEVLTVVAIAASPSWLFYPHTVSLFIRFVIVFALIVMPGAKAENRYGPIPEAAL
jgi:uncharacterized membrane protein YhaH (DUF805 family)